MSSVTYTGTCLSLRHICDNVMIISGKDKGHTGKVLQVSPSENKVIVEGQNLSLIHI